MKKYRTDMEVINFEYFGVDCDYGRYGGDPDDYNRGSKINNAHVTAVNTNRMVEAIINQINQYDICTGASEFDKYCIDRILVCHKVYEKDAWNIAICNGYYGEEIGGIYLADESILKNIWEMFGLKSNRAKIEFILTLEYGYILDCLKDCNYTIDTIKKSDIKFGNDSYSKKVNKLEAYSDENYTLPRGIVTHFDDWYKLVDGYHRFNSCTKAKIKMIVAK
jgi:hypothetical protein